MHAHTAQRAYTLSDTLHTWACVHPRYVGSVSLLKEIAAVARTLRRWNPQLTYVCDPVLGDEGRLYVPKELIGTYRDEVLPLASVLVPNQVGTKHVMVLTRRLCAQCWCQSGRNKAYHGLLTVPSFAQCTLRFSYQLLLRVRVWEGKRQFATVQT